ncbi:protein ALP1-like [Magnolia sinica]|uniref:protein ALP1-like n=1 Tax=Magnolia sinica TaxID=86752 RepID=UPI002658170F|nr:protein ALP1-like [Magnolia sinica]
MVEKRSSSCKKTSNGSGRKKKKLTQEDLSSIISLVASATTLSRSFLFHNDLLLHPSQTLTLESSINTTALSLSKLHSSLSLPSPPFQTLTADHPSPWAHRFLSDPSTHLLFLDSFRISKPSFDRLLQILTPSLLRSSLSVPPNFKLAAALFRLAHAAPFKSVGRWFGIDSAAACRSFYEVCKAVNDTLSNLLQSDRQRILDGFGAVSLPNCCGVLGFSRFFIDGGLGNDGTVIVQGLVDSEGRFLDVSAGWPGSMPPDTILRQTNLFSRVEESKEMLNGPTFELAGGNSIRQYVLGDSCCPLLPWLLTPYRQTGLNENDSRQVFNSVHGRGMALVNNAFGRVLARWRLLSARWKQDSVEFFPFIIISGCLLHNFLIKCGEPTTDEIGDYLREQRFQEHEEGENEGGKSVRDVLASHLSLVSHRE